MGRADDAERERLVWGEICKSLDMMVDIVGDISEDNIAKISAIDGVIRVRVI